MVVAQAKKAIVFEAALWLFKNTPNTLINNPRVADLLNKIDENLKKTYEIDEFLQFSRTKEVPKSIKASDVRTSLIKILVVVGQKLAAHANYTKQIILFRESCFYEKDFVVATDLRIKTVASIIIQRAEEHYNALLEYNLTQAQLDELRSVYSVFIKETPIVEEPIVAPVRESFTLRSTLMYIRLNEGLMDELDSFVEAHKMNDLVLYHTYFMYRQGALPANKSKEIRIGIFNSKTGNRIEGATIRLSRIGASLDQFFSRVSTSKRNALFKNIADGEWNIIVTDDRYNQVIKTYTVKAPYQTIFNILLDAK